MKWGVAFYLRPLPNGRSQSYLEALRRMCSPFHIQLLKRLTVSIRGPPSTHSGGGAATSLNADTADDTS